MHHALRVPFGFAGAAMLRVGDGNEVVHHGQHLSARCAQRCAPMSMLKPTVASVHKPAAAHLAAWQPGGGPAAQQAEPWRACSARRVAARAAAFAARLRQPGKHTAGSVGPQHPVQPTEPHQRLRRGHGACRMYAARRTPVLAQGPMLDIGLHHPVDTGGQPAPEAAADETGDVDEHVGGSVQALSRRGRG
jgi:hypothetical protein